MGVTPELLRRDAVVNLLGEIERRNAVDSAGRFLFDQGERGWTEYSLYWLYVLERAEGRSRSRAVSANAGSRTRTPRGTGS